MSQIVDLVSVCFHLSAEGRYLFFSASEIRFEAADIVLPLRSESPRSYPIPDLLLIPRVQCLVLVLWHSPRLLIVLPPFVQVLAIPLIPTLVALTSTPAPSLASSR